MPIEILSIAAPNGAPIIRQGRDRPAVYLDTCASRAIAANPVLSDRFVRAVRAKGGCLMLSVLTFIEFASFDDPRHAREVHALVESLGRSIFFARFEPWQVVNKENDLLTARMGDAPEGDLEFLLRVMEPHARHGVPFNVGVIFDYVAEHAKELRARLEGLKHATLEGVVAIRERVDNEQGFDGVIRRSISEADRPRATLALARAMVDFLQSDRARPLNINDAADLLHTVVPVAYCDFVVLDRKWRTMAEQARRRLDSNGVEAQTAKVFDAGPKGIEHFLTSLEQFQR